MLQRSLHALMAINPRLPAEELAGAGDVRPADFGIIFRQRFEGNRALASRQGNSLAGEIQDRHFMRVAQVDRIMEVGRQKPINPFDEIGHIAEAARLAAIPLNREGPSAERLADAGRNEEAARPITVRGCSGGGSHERHQPRR